MKLLFILSEYLPTSGGGIISYYEGVLPHLVEAGHEIHVLVTRADLMDRADCEVGGVRITYLKSDLVRKATPGFARYRVNQQGLATLLPVAWAAWEQTRHGEGFDLIETTDFDLLFAPWIGTTNAPVNISLHGSCGQLEWYARPPHHPVGADMVRLVELAAFSSAQAVQANSEINAGFWRDLTHREIKVLLPACPISDQALVRSKPLADGVVIGRLQIWKGPQVLCQALTELPDARVRWIGRDVFSSNWGLSMSQMLRQQYPKVFATRLIHQEGVSHSEALQAIAQASFLCVPSTWDVFNLTVVEAMFLGTPVICSRQAGASMLIRHGENGFLFDSTQPAELAECIRRVHALTETERADLIGKARATVDQTLDPSRLCAGRIDYYRTIPSNPRRALDDEWLQTTLSPRQDKDDRTEILQAFSAKELISATGRQIVNGIKRRLSAKSKGP